MKKAVKTDSMQTPPLILLIHGAWHGAWCWDRLTPSLEKTGFPTLSINLLGRNESNGNISLKDHVASIMTLIDEPEQPIFIVGHSFGGVVADQLAENITNPVIGIAHIASFLLKNGESLFDIVSDNPSKISTSLVFSEKYLGLDWQVAQDCFYNHCDLSTAEWAAKQLCPEPLLAMQTPIHITEKRHQQLKKYYFLCTDDKATLPDFQRKMCTRYRDINVIDINSDHSPFLSHPTELANQLIKIIKSLY